MDISEIVPDVQDRMFVTGMTESGKTTLILRIIYALEEEGDNLIVIIDSDHMWEYQKRTKLKYKPHIPIEVKNAGQLVNETSGTFIYRAKYPALYDKQVKLILEWAMTRTNVTIVIDEISDFAKNNLILEILGRVIKQGRKLNVRLIMGTQRPATIPVICITESKVFAVFQLSRKEDRERMASDVNPDFAVMMTGHDFMIFKRKWKEPIVIRQ